MSKGKLAGSHHMQFIEDYILIVAKTKEDISILVKNSLENSYNVYGNPFIDKEGNFCQAMIKFQGIINS